LPRTKLIDLIIITFQTSRRRYSRESISKCTLTHPRVLVRGFTTRPCFNDMCIITNFIGGVNLLRYTARVL